MQKTNYLEQQRAAELAALETMKDEIGFTEMKGRTCQSGKSVYDCFIIEMPSTHAQYKEPFIEKAGTLNPVPHRHFRTVCKTCGQVGFQAEKLI